MAAKCTLASRVDSFHESSDGKVSVRMSCGGIPDLTQSKKQNKQKLTDVLKYV